MLGAGQTSQARGASELVTGLEVVVLWVEIRVGASQAMVASELVVCSPFLVAVSPVVVKIKIYVSLSQKLNCEIMVAKGGHVLRPAPVVGDGQEQGSHVLKEALADGGTPNYQDAEQDGTRDGQGCVSQWTHDDAGVPGGHVRASQRTHHYTGDPGGQAQQSQDHHDVVALSGQEGVRGQARGALGSGYGLLCGQEGGELGKHYKGCLTFLSSPDVAHASVLAAAGSYGKLY